MKLEGRVAVVTGAAQGIGRAYVNRLLADGAKVVFCDVQDNLGEEALAAFGSNARYKHCDVTQEAEVEALMSYAVEIFGRLDISIANAGIVHHADFLEVDVEDFNRVMTVNVTGAFLTGQKAAKQMIACGNGGSIINIASTNAVVVNLGQVPYAASKGAIVLLTKVMAVSLADYRIRVNAIGPGSVRTPMFDDVVERMPGMEDMILSRTPMRRISDPSEIAQVASFLASDESSYITGQTIYVDGGRMGLNYMMPSARAGE